MLILFEKLRGLLRMVLQSIILLDKVIAIRCAVYKIAFFATCGSVCLAYMLIEEKCRMWSGERLVHVCGEDADKVLVLGVQAFAL